MKKSTVSNTVKAAKGRFIGSFLIDPKSDIYKEMKPYCEPGHPCRCLIGTYGAAYLGVRLRAMLNQDDPRKSYIGITDGEWSWKRPMTDEEIRLATLFDNNRRVMKPITVVVDTRDPVWTRVPKKTTGGSTKDREAGTRSPNRQGTPSVRYVRQRQLSALRKRATTQS